MNKKKYVKKHKITYGTGFREVQVAREKPHRFFSDLYYHLLSISWFQFIFFIFIGYIFINIIFGVLYFSQGPEGLSGQHPTGTWPFFLQCYFFSVQTLSTIGYGVMAPQTFVTHVIVSVQALVGMLSIGVISGLFFSRFTRSTAKIVFSEQILLTQHLGQKSLVFRLANERINVIVNAKVHATLLYNDVTPEGTNIRRLIDLKLTRDFNAIFFLNWVLAHEIDETSPFYNLDMDELKNKKAEIMVTFSGTDQTFGQSIHSSHIYPISKFVLNKNFEDMLIRENDDFTIHFDKISHLK